MLWNEGEGQAEVKGKLWRETGEGWSFGQVLLGARVGC